MRIPGIEPEAITRLRDLGLGGIDLAELGSGTSIAQSTLERLACDCRLQVVLEDNGIPVAISSPERTVPPHISRALRRRDQGCRFPGCGNKRFLHAHHIVFWTQGGKTIWTNLVCLCPFHHHLVHEGGWSITGDPEGQLTFRRPNGTPLEPPPSPARVTRLG